MGISIVIVTKNRQLLLQKCLASIVFQSVSPSEIIIVDNGSNDETLEIVKNYSKNVAFPIRLISEYRSGYPYIYNTGLFNATQNWVGVIDDDCTICSDWIDSMSQMITNYPKSAAILGSTQTQNKKNPYSLLTHIFDLYWKENGIKGDKIVNFEILDNKNIIYNKKFLLKNNIKYDESRAKLYLGAGEDSDLGMQIKYKNGQAFVNRNAIAAHKDADSLIWFFRKFISNFVAYLYFKEKWAENSRKSVVAKKNLSSVYEDVVSENMVPFVQSVYIFFLLLTFIFFSLILERAIQFQWIKKRFMAFHNPRLQVSI